MKDEYLKSPLHFLPHFLLSFFQGTSVCLCLSLPDLMGSSRLLPACHTDSSQGVFPTLSLCICSNSAPRVGKFAPQAQSELQAPQGACIPKAPPHRSPSGSRLYHRE